jgi:hypothetical protein
LKGLPKLFANKVKNRTMKILSEMKGNIKLLQN